MDDLGVPLFLETPRWVAGSLFYHCWLPRFGSPRLGGSKSFQLHLGKPSNGGATWRATSLSGPMVMSFVFSWKFFWHLELRCWVLISTFIFWSLTSFVRVGWWFWHFEGFLLPLIQSLFCTWSMKSSWMWPDKLKSHVELCKSGWPLAVAQCWRLARWWGGESLERHQLTWGRIFRQFTADFWSFGLVCGRSDLFGDFSVRPTCFSKLGP